MTETKVKRLLLELAIRPEAVLCEITHDTRPRRAAENEPWTVENALRPIAAALGEIDYTWIDVAAGRVMQRRLRLRRMVVIWASLADIRAQARDYLEDWRSDAAWTRDYSGDPLLQMIAIHTLIAAIWLLSIWRLALALPAPVAPRLLELCEDVFAPLNARPRSASL